MWFIKGVGGVQGQKYKLILYERVFQCEVSAFYGMLKFNSQLKIFAFEYGRVCRKSPLSLIFSYIKNELKMSQNHEYFHVKYLLNMFDDVFSCTSTYQTIKNHQGWLIFRILENIDLKQANFCRKWARNLKNAISQKHIFEQNLRTKSARNLKFGQVMGKND